MTPLIEKNYQKRAAAKGGRADPEDRLVGMMIGCWFVPISMFIFGWTSPPYVQPGGGNWVGPASSGIPFGFGSKYMLIRANSIVSDMFLLVVIIYFSANAYIIDAFPGYVASALAAKTVIRSGSGAAMPLFIEAMYHNLGNGWAASTWAFISIAMVRLPADVVTSGLYLTARSHRSQYHSCSIDTVKLFVPSLSAPSRRYRSFFSSAMAPLPPTPLVPLLSVIAYSRRMLPIPLAAEFDTELFPHYPARMTRICPIPFYIGFSGARR